jgi:membrane protease YdiL (CAAX protease family)
VFARLRLGTGSVWPAIALHSAWNAIIQSAFDPASKGAGAELWIGESGILVALTMILAAVIYSCGRWTIRRARGEQRESGAARAGPGQFLALSIVALMFFAPGIPGRGNEASEAPTLTSHGSVLPRDLIVPLSTVKEILPEISRETATGQDETAVGKPIGTRSVHHMR